MCGWSKLSTIVLWTLAVGGLFLNRFLVMTDRQLLTSHSQSLPLHRTTYNFFGFEGGEGELVTKTLPSHLRRRLLRLDDDEFVPLTRQDDGVFDEQVSIDFVE